MTLVNRLIWYKVEGEESEVIKIVDCKLKLTLAKTYKQKTLTRHDRSWVARIPVVRNSLKVGHSHCGKFFAIFNGQIKANTLPPVNVLITQFICLA